MLYGGATVTNSLTLITSYFSIYHSSNLVKFSLKPLKKRALVSVFNHKAKLFIAGLEKNEKKVKDENICNSIFPHILFLIIIFILFIHIFLSFLYNGTFLEYFIFHQHLKKKKQLKIHKAFFCYCTEKNNWLIIPLNKVLKIRFSTARFLIFRVFFSNFRDYDLSHSSVHR